MIHSSFVWMENCIDLLKAHIAQESFPRDGAHSLGHILRVARLALEIARAESADEEICLAAALLHDLVYLPKNHPDSALTATKASELVPDWCNVLGLMDKAEQIAEAVNSHSFSKGLSPASLEAAVLQDADRLEAIGAIGIARTFATGGSMGIELWDDQDPWAGQRQLNDKQYSLDHFAQKLLKLAERMNTQTGRHLAHKRHQLLLRYLEALKEELGIVVTLDG